MFSILLLCFPCKSLHHVGELLLYYIIFLLAEELNMPLFLHERAAHRDFKAILKEHKDICKKAVVHCFTGTGGEMQAYLELGCSIGITGWICDERRGEHLRTLVKRIPLKARLRWNSVLPERTFSQNVLSSHFFLKPIL